MNVKMYIEQKNGKQIPITLRDGTTGQIEAFQFYPASGNLEVLVNMDNSSFYGWIAPHQIKKA